MSGQLQYSSGLNGATFLLYELKQIIKLKLEDLSEQEIRSKAREENVFQFNNPNRTNRVLPTLMRREKVIDSTIGQAFIDGTADISKAINLYAIMKTDRLFFEFMNEVVRPKFEDNNHFLEKKDMNVFFNAKAEQNEIVSNWSDTNQEKLKRAMLTVLYESGILIKRQGQEIKPLILDEDIKQHLIDIGDQEYVKALGEVII